MPFKFIYHRELNHYVIHHQAKTFLQWVMDQQHLLFPKECSQNDFVVFEVAAQ